ncbi:MAG: hypothetical protein AAFP76_09500 [Bacteroidota bacterium]
MGARIVFFTASNQKSLQENFLKDFSKFRDWTLSNWSNSESKDIGELSMGQRINERALKYLERNQFIAPNIDHEIFDELVAVYFCSYCDHGEGKELYELRGPMMNKWRYDKSTELVNHRCDSPSVQLWNRLNFGCSTNPKMKVSQSLSKDLILGWWTVEEMKKMKENLSNVFKSLSQFNEWNALRKKGNFFRKEYEGLGYVYDMLDIGVAENKEVIFYNEPS